ncbi:putative trna isopentenyltransferase [Phaeomoniella chlamydospora]|uniref:tRNA dimethylallyltransferase n=1 Tax=Phaeomoniella chlamydospora TaxID=158046 RepID=A0A0G2ETM1_PHACM|nr:putative trna isopentenyltransferase [Phaeomoniella chlamydospora]
MVVQWFKRTIMNPPKDPLIAIVGATGTGKSKLAVDLALRFNGEIINGDAMQMYKGLPVITNKITPSEAQGIPHHLFDFVNPLDRPWNVGTFTHECLKVLGEIRDRGKIPILVGGTHYYTQALLFKDSLVKAGPDVENLEQNESNEEGREGRVLKQESKVEKEERWPILAAAGEEIYAKLKEVDPAMARRWHPKDTRKVRRSLEIWLETGRRASEIYEEQRVVKENAGINDELKSRLRFPTVVFWIRSENEVLRDRLDQRVDQMVAGGLFNEVEAMEDMAAEASKVGIPVDFTSGIWASIGFKEVQPYVVAKRSDPPPNGVQEMKLKSRAIELTKIATRQYANRQERWIKYKFMDAMEEMKEVAKVFPVDSTVVDAWDKNVKLKTEAVTSAFLHGSALPDPKSTSAMAKTLLNSVELERDLKAKNRAPEMHECALCNKILMTRGQWQEHLSSNRHKKALRYQSKAINRPT